VLKGLVPFGVELDEEKNAEIKSAAGGEGEISTMRSMVKVLVIPANEEAILARETVQVVMKSREQATGNKERVAVAR
jgi:acetate kinase